MLPVFGTAAVLTAAPAPLLSSGYVPGNTLAAQHLNWYLFHLTKEMVNVLNAQGISQLVTDDTQLLQAVGRTNVLISTSGTVTTASQFAGHTLTQFSNPSGSSNYVITAGASRPGIELIVEALTGSGVMIVNGSGSAFLGSGAVRLLWDGSQWCKIGGNSFMRAFSSGSGTWYTPWKGSYKVVVTGGGGGGGGVNNTGGGVCFAAGGGGGGGTAISVLAESAMAALSYSIGSGGGGGSTTPSDGSPGGSSFVSDGLVTLIGTGGGGGKLGSTGAYGLENGGAGGSGIAGLLNLSGNGGAGGGYLIPSTSGVITGIAGGKGGGSYFGGGAPGVVPTGNTGSNGLSGSNYGGGGSGGSENFQSAGTYSASGGSGASGVVMIEF